MSEVVRSKDHRRYPNLYDEASASLTAGPGLQLSGNEFSLSTPITAGDYYGITMTTTATGKLSSISAGHSLVVADLPARLWTQDERLPLSNVTYYGNASLFITHETTTSTTFTCSPGVYLAGTTYRSPALGTIPSNATLLVRVNNQYADFNRLHRSPTTQGSKFVHYVQNSVHTVTFGDYSPGNAAIDTSVAPYPTVQKVYLWKIA